MKIKFSNVGDRISAILNEKGMSKAELSRRTGISQNAITNYCKNVRLPDTTSIYLIAQALDILVEWLLTGEGEKHHHPIEVPGDVWMLRDYQRQAIDEQLSDLTVEQALLLNNYEKLWPKNKQEVRLLIQLKLELQAAQPEPEGRREQGLA